MLPHAFLGMFPAVCDFLSDQLAQLPIMIPATIQQTTDMSEWSVTMDCRTVLWSKSLKIVPPFYLLNCVEW